MFLSGSPRLAAIFIMIPPGFAAIGPGLIVCNLLTGALAVTRRFFDGAADFRQSPQFRRVQNQLIVGSAVLAAAALFISIYASFAQFCLTPENVVVRSEPWGATRSYSWNAVRTVTTSCESESETSWNASYVLGFSDGRSLDLMNGTAQTWKALPQITAALHGRAFKFDATGVASDCGADNVDLLARHPGGAAPYHSSNPNPGTS